MLLSISFPKLLDGEVMFVRTCLCVFVCLSGSFIMRTLRAGPAEFDGCKVLYSLTLYVIFHSVSLVPRGAITISNQKKEKKNCTHLKSVEISIYASCFAILHRLHHIKRFFVRDLQRPVKMCRNSFEFSTSCWFPTQLSEQIGGKKKHTQFQS